MTDTTMQGFSKLTDVLSPCSINYWGQSGEISSSNCKFLYFVILSCQFSLHVSWISVSTCINIQDYCVFSMPLSFVLWKAPRVLWYYSLFSYLFCQIPPLLHFLFAFAWYIIFHPFMFKCIYIIKVWFLKIAQFFLAFISIWQSLNLNLNVWTI